jgi:hypothetical protein
MTECAICRDEVRTTQVCTVDICDGCWKEYVMFMNDGCVIYDIGTRGVNITKINVISVKCPGCRGRAHVSKKRETRSETKISREKDITILSRIFLSKLSCLDIEETKDLLHVYYAYISSNKKDIHPGLLSELKANLINIENYWKEARYFYNKLFKSI